jgi:formylglycine-generating enzyme
VSVSGRAPGPAAPAMPSADGMVWIPGAAFTMGSERHYPEEAPAHPVTVSGFWIDPRPVTNRPVGAFPANG